MLEPIRIAEIQDALQRIYTSKLFHNNKHGQFLKYLVDKSLASDPPKETTIALEFFGEKPNSQKETSYVRVAVYHLRKKLKEYDLTEGQADPIRVVLKKGAYEVSFVRNHPQELPENIDSSPRQNLPLAYGFLVGAVLILASVIAYHNLRSKPQSSAVGHLILEDFDKRAKPVLVVLGDLFMHYNAEGSLTRDFQINSMRELVEKKPELVPQNTSLSRSRYLTRLHAIGLYHLSSLLNQLDNEVHFRMASELSIEDLKENNLIYVGLFKSMYLIDSYYLSSNFTPSPIYHELIHKQSGDTLRIEGDPGAHHTDYGILARITGLNDNMIYLIAGFTDTSVERIIASITYPDIASEEMEACIKNVGFPTNFEVVFGVSGYDRKEASNIWIQQCEVLNSGLSIR